jgi:class 3 adenylate cyclase/uncharacterized RDD family membrane protein YckC
MAGKVKSRNLSIMLTDLQGYTKTSTQCSREEIINLIRSYNQLMIPIIEAYGGTVIKTIGDAFLCTFESATDAVICAIIIQLVLKDYNQKQTIEHLKMNTRVVVHSGDVSIEGNDIFGDAVNVTARIEGLECFPGGSIGISETTYLLMDKTEVKAEKIGPQTLKGIPEPITVFQIPLELQKIKEIPPALSNIVKKLIGTDGTGISSNINEWKNSIQTYIKEKNWGENISNNISKVQESIGQSLNQAKKDLGNNLQSAQKHLEKNIGQVQNRLAQKIAPVGTRDQQGVTSLTEAPVASRSKAFFIDMALLVVLTIILNIGWWGISRVMYGPASLDDDAYYKLSYEARKQFSRQDVDGETLYVRHRGVVEFLISLALRFPPLPAIFYFGLLWRITGASAGQMAVKNAVVKEDGSPLTLEIALKRSFIFVFSTLFFGIGPLLGLIGEKKTLYDRLCQTRVVE